MTDLSDKALAVFAFAAYHQLESGQAVTSIVRDDGRGHKADDGAIGELQSADLVETETNAVTFTSAGLGMLARVVEGMRGAVRQA